MPDYKHLFLVPLVKIDTLLIKKITSLAEYNPAQFLFVISIQNVEDYNNFFNFFKNYQNIYLTKPDKKYDRARHWAYIIDYAIKKIEFDSFSYFFSGDDLDLKKFPIISLKNDIYINDYYINDWRNIKENAAQKVIMEQPAKNIINKNLLLGKPILAPLQKIIFSRAVATGIFFDASHSYICDQLMVNTLIEQGAKVRFLKKPFYKLNTHERVYSKKIHLREILRQQIYLYMQLSCYIGIPMIMMRTLIKHFLLRTR
ncbi:hypothetical protein ACNY9Y_002537 [Cronobacter dublinensis]